jgi:NAD(P)-dependent dehydrogenase (short-subunit alcohol dehydrogenase family)
MLDGQTAIITGASRGIGAVTAERFAELGGNVTIAARSDAIHDTADRVGEEQALAVRTDVSVESDIEAAIEATVQRFGGLDCVVNNAAIAGPTARVENTPSDGWQETLDVNLTGAFYMCKHAVPYLKESDRASIINISSITGKRPLPERIGYAATKIGLIGMARTLAFELGDDGITVNTICPGTVRTERLKRVFETHAEEMGVSYQEALDEIVLNDCAIPELQEPEEVAEMIALMASEHGRHITAQDIGIDSGATWY